MAWINEGYYAFYLKCILFRGVYTWTRWKGADGFGLRVGGDALRLFHKSTRSWPLQIETQLEKSIAPGAFTTTMNISLFCYNTYPCFTLTAPRALFPASPGQLDFCHTPTQFPVLSREYNIILLLMHVRAVYRVLVFLGVKPFSAVIHRCFGGTFFVQLRGWKVSQASDQQEENIASSILGLLFNL
jgi:hypothetical protein